MKILFIKIEGDDLSTNHESKAPMVTRYTRPSSLDNEVYGIQWRYMCDNNTHETYIQLSEDANKPRWEKIGTLFEIAFEELYERDDFIQECLKLFKYKENGPLKKIVEILKEKI